MASLFAKKRPFRSAELRSRSVEKSKPVKTITNCLRPDLPFLLQDLCLLVVINELDCYATELLAALPYWLRCRLLNNVPTLDLARLERTSVTNGVDIDEIWKSHLNIVNEVDTQVESSCEESPFQLNISRNIDRHLFTPMDKYHGGNTLTQDIVKELTGMKCSKLSTGDHLVLTIASGLLTSSFYGRHFRLEKAVRRLVSISGDLVLSNMLIGSRYQQNKESFCNQEDWKKQQIPLTIKEEVATVIARPCGSYYTDCRRQQITTVYLIPRRFLCFYDKPDPVELLLLLLRDFVLHPHIVNIHIDVISESFLPSLHAERLALDNSLCLPTDGAKHTSIINRLLENVVSLRLQCDQYDLVCVMVSMVKAATANGHASNLKHLICALPDLYLDIMDALCALFLLPNFHLLSLDLGDVYPLMLSKLLQAFITTPCPHKHKLLIYINGGVQFQMTLKENQVAAMDVQGLAIPCCSLQHKILKFSSNENLTEGLYLLLQFPEIRLKQLTLFSNNKYLHFCAIHPNLQITKLMIIITGIARQHRKRPRHVATLQQDIVSLLQINLLQKVCIQGNSGPSTEIKLGVLFGLHARTNMPPLKKLSLELKAQNSYEIKEFVKLCDAVFSLPQLEILNLVLGEGFADIVQEHEDVMYKSWCDRGGGAKLKSILLRTYIETDFKKVALITQSLHLSVSEHQSGGYSSYDDYCYDYSDDDVSV